MGDQYSSARARWCSMSTIRERVTNAAVSAIHNACMANYGTAAYSERAGWFFDVARRAGAGEHEAAFIALDYLGEYMEKHWTAVDRCPGTAWNEAQRARGYISAGSYMRGAAQGFAREGREAVFNRLVEQAENAA